jgi:RNA polymerase sigma-70 factor (ECF subfamily)
METSDLIARARAGDDNAFRELVEVHSHELQVHCYRILGSLQDAEDALQETLVSAWRNLGDFRQQSSLRTWLYQIATNRCLSMLRADSRRPRTATPLPDLTLPEPTGVSDAPPWLEPYPDVLLDNLVDQAPGPETRYETTEAISLAFITALQLLPPRQRAVLVLRDVLGYHAGEVAGMLDATQESVQSALKRARATVDSYLADSGNSRPARHPDTAAEHQLVVQLTDALERADLQALVGLLVDDVRLSMPPAMLEYRGIDVARRFFAAVTLRPGRSFRHVCSRPSHRCLPGLRTACRHDRRRPYHRGHRLRRGRDATVRAASDASRSGLKDQFVSEPSAASAIEVEPPRVFPGEGSPGWRWAGGLVRPLALRPMAEADLPLANAYNDRSWASVE